MQKKDKGMSLFGSIKSYEFIVFNNAIVNKRYIKEIKIDEDQNCRLVLEFNDGTKKYRLFETVDDAIIELNDLAMSMSNCFLDNKK